MGCQPPSWLRRVPCFGSAGRSDRSPSRTHVQATSIRQALTSEPVPFFRACAKARSSRARPIQVATSSGFLAALIRATPIRCPWDQASRTRRLTNQVKTVGLRGVCALLPFSMCPFPAAGSGAGSGPPSSERSGTAHSAGSSSPSARTSRREWRGLSALFGTFRSDWGDTSQSGRSPCKSPTFSDPAVPNSCRHLCVCPVSPHGRRRLPAQTPRDLPLGRDNERPVEGRLPGQVVMTEEVVRLVLATVRSPVVDGAS